MFFFIFACATNHDQCKGPFTPSVAPEDLICYGSYYSNPGAVKCPGGEQYNEDAFVLLSCTNAHCAEEYRTPPITSIDDTCWYCVKKARLEGWAKNCGCDIRIADFALDYGPPVAYIYCDDE
jgi:hypothetical protein